MENEVGWESHEEKAMKLSKHQFSMDSLLVPYSMHSMYSFVYCKMKWIISSPSWFWSSHFITPVETLTFIMDFLSYKELRNDKIEAFENWETYAILQMSIWSQVRWRLNVIPSKWRHPSKQQIVKAYGYSMERYTYAYLHD